MINLHPEILLYPSPGKISHLFPKAKSWPGNKTEEEVNVCLS